MVIGSIVVQAAEAARLVIWLLGVDLRMSNPPGVAPR